WQWAFRGGTERQMYERLWSALAGWLAQERSVASLPPVRPARMTVPRATPVPWVAPGAQPDSARVTLTDAAGAVVLDTIVRGSRADTLFTSTPSPGHFSYRVLAFAGDNVLEGNGPLTVESYSAELSRRGVD